MDALREMIGFVSQRLTEPEASARIGAGYGEKNYAASPAQWLLWVRLANPGRHDDPQAGPRQLFPELPVDRAG